MKHKILTALLLLGLTTLLIGCNNAEQSCEGTIVSCSSLEQDKVLLLYNNKVYPSPNEAPINEDTICVYDLNSGHEEIIAKENNIRANANDQIIILPSQILYNSETTLWQFTENGQKWQVSNQPSNNLRVLSPSGEKFAERQDENIVIINRQSGEILTQTSSINQASVMQWSYDEQHLALIADRNSSIIIWDLKTNDLQTLRLEQELPNIENWVDIINLSYTADSQYLLATILCENGMALLVINTDSAAAEDLLTNAGDISVLDTEGSKILYSIDENKANHYLNIYDCQSNNVRTIDQGNFYYPAACFTDEQHIIVNKFNPEAQENNLTVLNI